MLKTSTTTSTTFAFPLFADGDEFDARMEVIADEFAEFTRGVERSRDIHFRVPGNEDGQSACKACLAHHGVSLAQADSEASDWSDELRTLLFEIVGDLHGRRVLTQKWQRVGEAVTRLPADVRAAHLGYAQVAFEVVEMHRSRLVVDQRRAMYDFGF